MSLTLLALTAAVAAGAGYVVARKYKQDALVPDGDPAAAADSAKKDASTKKEGDGAGSTVVGLPLELGDVVQAEGEERWLAGALMARESGRVVAAVFFAPEGGTQHAVAVFAAPRPDIHWLAPAEADCPGEPPATLEISGDSFTRKSRLPVRLERVGQGVPQVEDVGVWGSYEGGGREVALVVTSAGKTLAWRGRRLDDDEYERLGKGGDG